MSALEIDNQFDAERAVLLYKHKLAVRVMRFIVLLALREPYVSPGDVPEDIVEKQHRQGVASNAWNSLARGKSPVLEKPPLNFSDERFGIFGGRKRNDNSGAKKRWTAAYRIRSRALALTWLERNSGAPETEIHKTQQPAGQMDLLS
jgi:hypothetical protein